VSDSRAVVAASAFVALKGPTFDGHDFLEQAVAKGAALLVVEAHRAPHGAPVDVVEVDGTLDAWAALARAHLRAWRRERESTRTFAITGSAGKTTTKDLCAALLSAAGSCHKTAGNLNNRIGVPAVAFGVRAEHDSAVFELGMSVRGEIAALTGIVEPDVAILTNVGVAHAEGVGGDRAGVAREKGDLFAGLSAEAVAVVNFDDEAAAAQVARTRARRSVTFGTGSGADYRLAARTGSLDGSSVVIERRRDGSSIEAHVPLVGEGAALDFCAALAAVESVGSRLDGDAASRALRDHVREPAGRMQVRRLANGTTVIDDTYNANPQSVRAALHALAEIAGARSAVVVLGEMKELGSIASAEHASLGAELARSGARLALSCGGLADESVQNAERLGLAGELARGAEDASRRAVALVRAGEVVLVKASRSVGAERVVEALIRAGGGEVTRPETAP
jgi:UDP-N-acetylmuramoyl-tripeptide--D-alanyl-D-alanine ligase